MSRPPDDQPSDLPRPALSWTPRGAWSADAGDHYHGPDAMAQVQRVFLGLNQLPQRLRNLQGCLHIGETGFGTGLNFAATCQLFLATAASSSRLLYSSFELAPPDHNQLAEISRQQPALAAIYRELAAAWPPRLPGWHRRHLFAGRVQLCLYFGPAAAGLDSLADNIHPVDAWFLDGFAPDRNPDLWTGALFQALAARSHPGTTLATYTSVGAVRRGLQAAGFHAERADGQPLKLHWLRGQAQHQGNRCGPANPAPPRVLVAGAGLAGACVARSLAEAGAQVQVLDAGSASPEGIGSSNPAAVLHARLPVQSGPLQAWRAAAWAYASHWLAGRPGFYPAPVLQRPGPAVSADHLARGLAQATPLGPWVHAAAAGEADHLAGIALPRTPGPTAVFPGGGWANLPLLCQSLLDHANIQIQTQALVQGLEQGRDGLRVLLAEGAISPDHLVLCLGRHTLGLCRPLLDMTAHHLRATGEVRGQLSQFKAPGAAGHGLRAVLTGDGYALASDQQHLWLGATFERQQPLDAVAAAADNLQRLHTLMGPPAEVSATANWSGVRCTTADRMPLAGLLPGQDRVHLLTGLGASGLLHAPLAAALLTAQLCHQPAAAPAAAAGCLDPGRRAVQERNHS